MNNLRIPIRFWQIDCRKPLPFEGGHLVSTLNRCGFFFCRKGEIKVSLEGRVYPIGPNDLYVYMPSAQMRVLSISPETEGIMAAAETDYALPIVNRVTNTESLLHVRRHPCIALTDEQAARFGQLTETLRERIRCEEKNPTPPHRRLTAALLKSMGETLIYEMLILYFANRPAEALPLDKKDQVFQNFMIALSRFYHQERDVAFYARLQHITPRYFSTLIREKSGSHASSWIIQKVIAESKQMLESSDLSIKEIAEQLHFPTQSFFGKYFKQYVGMSPKAYRKSQLKG